MSQPDRTLVTEPDVGWRRRAGQVSLAEVHRSVVVPVTASFWRKLLAFSGPGFLVAVGYMDPGNWATDLAGGALFAKQRIPLHGGAGHYANRDDRQLLRSRAHFFKTRLRWSHARICSQSAYCHESGDALHRHRHSGCDRYAAQSLPAFINCADAQV